MPTPTVLATSRNPEHGFSKLPQPSIHLLAGLGIEGDAHCGATIRHRYLRRRDPTAPNLMQVSLLASELLLTLAEDAALQPPIPPGDLGENITTTGLTLETLPLGTRLHLGPTAVLELTYLRSPCRQMNDLRPNLMKQTFHPGTRNPRAGVLAIVLATGTVHPADPITLELPPTPHHPLRLA